MATDTAADFDKLWDYSQPAASEARFQALLPQAERAGDASYLAQLLAHLARAQGLQNHFDSAHATLDRAAVLITPELHSAQALYLLERGRVFNSAEQPEQARALFLQAWELARAHADDGNAVDAAHMLGIVEPPAQKLEWERRAFELAERSEQPAARKWYATLLNNMGWSHHELGEHEQALALFERALAAREAAGDAQLIHIARWCIARELRALGRYGEALAMQQQLAAALVQSGASDGYVDEEIAENLLVLGQSDAARPYFARAHAALSQNAWLARSEAARLERLKALAEADARGDS